MDHKQRLFQEFNSAAAVQKELAVAQSLRNWVLLRFNKSLFKGAGAWLSRALQQGFLNLSHAWLLFFQERFYLTPDLGT